MATVRALLEQAEALYRREIQRSLLVDPTLVAVGRLVVRALQELRRCEVTTAEGEQIAAAKASEDVGRLKGIVEQQLGRIPETAFEDAAFLGRFVDALQALLDAVPTNSSVTNDTMQTSAA